MYDCILYKSLLKFSDPMTKVIIIPKIKHVVIAEASILCNLHVSHRCFNFKQRL